MDSAAHLLRRVAAHLDRALVYADFVRQDQPIVVRALRLRYAVIETEELCRVSHTGQPHCFPIRPVLDDDLDVVQFLLEHRRKVI